MVLLMDDTWSSSAMDARKLGFRVTLDPRRMPRCRVSRRKRRRAISALLKAGVQLAESADLAIPPA